MTTVEETLKLASEHFYNGRLAEAKALYRGLLDDDPDNDAAMMGLGVISAQEGLVDKAVALFERVVERNPEWAPGLSELALALERDGQHDRALDAMARAVLIDPDEPRFRINLGSLLYNLGRYDEAVAAFDEALELIPEDREKERLLVLSYQATAATDNHDWNAVCTICGTILALDPDNIEALDHLSAVADRLGRVAEARALRDRIARVQGLFLRGKLEKPEATVLLLGGTAGGLLPTRYLFDPERIQTRTLSLLSQAQPDAPLGEVAMDGIAACDVVFNVLGEVEFDGGQFAQVEDFYARLGKPVLNPIPAIRPTGRDNTVRLFGDIDGLVVPKTRWVSRDELVGMRDIGQPFLVRPAGAHGGVDLALIRSAEDIGAFLADAPQDRFLLTDFHDFKLADGHYRKYRLIFVDRRVYPYHLAVGDHWKVHYWRANMKLSPEKKREEERFLTDWRTVFGPRGAAAVEQVAARLDLDYAGLDCSILPDGRVLFFEANACMLVHLDDDPREFPYKHVAVPRIRDAVTEMILNRISRASTA